MKHTGPGKFTLERYFGGELDASAAQVVEAHLDRCRECLSYVQSLEHGKQDFLKTHPYNQWASIALKGANIPWYQRLRAQLFKPSLLPVYGMALVLCFIVPAVIMRATTPGVAYKSGSGLTFVYQRDGVVHQGVISERYQDGDQIQISYACSKKHFAGLLSVDTRGSVSMYHLQQQAPQMTVEQAGGGSILFPASIRLDNSAGQELIMLLIADNPLSTHEVKVWAEGLFETSENLTRMETNCHARLVSGAAEVRTLLLTKR